MDNIEQPTQTNPVPPKKLSKSKKRMSYKIIISVLVGLVFLVAIGYAYYRYSQSAKNTVLLFDNNQGSVNKISCSLSGQKVKGKILGGTETKFINLSPDAEKSDEMIARVLSVNPFLIEILDTAEGLSDFFDLLGAQQEYLFVSESEKAKISSLKFNDIISVNIYFDTYLDKVNPPVAIKDIKKIDSPVKHFNNSLNPSENRSGTLISYTSTKENVKNFLLISNDGKVFYHDNNRNVFTHKQLTEQELRDLLKLFSKVQYNNIPSDLSASLSPPSLSLICNRYQPISLDKNISQVKPITDKLDSIISNYRNEAKRKLTFAQRSCLKNWEYGSIVPLDEVSKVGFMKENESGLSQIKTPKSLVKERAAFYRYKGRIYSVNFDEHCPALLRDSWGCLRANEINTKVKRGEYYKVWPQELSVKLGSIGNGLRGVIIPREDYLAHKDFYDTLRAPLYLEDNCMYISVWISLKENYTEDE